MAVAIFLTNQSTRNRNWYLLNLTSMHDKRSSKYSWINWLVHWLTLINSKQLTLEVFILKLFFDFFATLKVFVFFYCNHICFSLTECTGRRCQVFGRINFPCFWQWWKWNNGFSRICYGSQLNKVSIYTMASNCRFCLKFQWII